MYDLYAWPRNPTNNFKFNDCLFGATNVVNISNKEKHVYNGYGITFDSADSWSFVNEFARNFIVFSADNISSSRSNNRKNIFLILGESPTYRMNGSFGLAQKKLSF